MSLPFPGLTRGLAGAAGGSGPVPAVSSAGWGQAAKKKTKRKKSGKAGRLPVFFTPLCFAVMPLSLLSSAPRLSRFGEGNRSFIVINNYDTTIFSGG
jgi:hypothetical protein